jgi:hypothetical protein
MNISTCRTYHSRTVATDVLRMPDGVSVFKLYFVSIIGRDTPATFEWEHAAFTTGDVARRLASSALEGVGFVIAFPHITKVFRFAPAMETIMHVRAFHTPDLSPLDLTRADGYVEYACYAEAAIAADEYHAWAAAPRVEDYLATRSAFVDGPVADHAKLQRFVRAVTP